MHYNWHENKALMVLIQKTDKEIRQKSEKLEALQNRRKLLKESLNKNLLSA